ncbi:MAG: antibiotic biosynthesis monooxygenase [Pseudoclavibacter sp.]|nr:antibiotic biosynthesis monooxygenase [Pseudoclavibacter sp.]
MTVVKINALQVPADTGDELARRFEHRAGLVDRAPGFEGFELLKPTDGRETWLVVTRWADEASYEAWSESREQQKAHDAAAGAERRAPVATGAELWSFVRVGGAEPASGA